MEQITAYKTLDGEVFEDRHHAALHADTVYSEAMLNFRQKLMDQTGLTLAEAFRVLEFLEGHSQTVAHISALKQDSQTLTVKETNE